MEAFLNIFKITISRKVVNLPPDKTFQKANPPHKTRDNMHGLGVPIGAFSCCSWYLQDLVIPCSVVGVPDPMMVFIPKAFRTLLADYFVGHK